MEKLVEMIQTFAEQAAVPAQEAAEKIVLAHYMESWMQVLVGVFYLILIPPILMFGHKIFWARAMKIEDDLAKAFGAFGLLAVGTFLTIFFLVSVESIFKNIVGIYEPAGHLMKTFLVK